MLLLRQSPNHPPPPQGGSLLRLLLLNFREVLTLELKNKQNKNGDNSSMGDNSETLAATLDRFQWQHVVKMTKFSFSQHF